MAKGKDTRDHSNRRVDRDSHMRRESSRITNSQDSDIAPAHGIPRPNTDEVLDEWDPEDIKEQQDLKEANNKGLW